MQKNIAQIRIHKRRSIVKLDFNALSRQTSLNEHGISMGNKLYLEFWEEQPQV